MSENNENLKQNKAASNKSKSKSKPFYYKKKRNSAKKTLESKVNDILLYEKIDTKKIAENKKQPENKKQAENKKAKEVKKQPENKKQTENKKITESKKASNKKENKKNSKQKKESKPASKKQSPIKIAFLGGLNEVGKNITLFEYEDDMILVDSGLAFPDEDMPGIDLVIPDFSYVEKNADKIKGICITHGHEDHIGSLAYLLKKVNVPVYSTRLTNGLIEGKLREHGILDKAKLNVVSPGKKVNLGKFEVEFIHVNHSIPDAVGFAIKCDGGTIVHTGDFKIDSTPIDGDIIDIARFAELGKQGVLCMMADSTNAERPGFTESESKVGASFELLFRKAEDRRIIVATFASNIHRVQQIIDVAEKMGRKVALSGRSLENVVAIGSELGYLKVPEGILIKLDLINNYAANEIVLITTGSQGEPMSALTRMAFSDHRKVAIGPNDYVIISATPIPGNEKTVSRVVNELMKLGAEVVYEKMYDVHVSGHACREELKLMLGIVKPQYFIPVHGEQKHLLKHAQLAEQMGIPSQNVIIADNGVQIEVCKEYIKKAGTVPAGKIFVDGSGVGDVGNIVLKDRKHLAEDGIIIVVATLDGLTGQLVSGPDVVSRGFVFVKESEELIEEAKQTAYDTMMKCYDRNIYDWGTIKNRVRDDVSRLMYERTKRSPMILPILMEI
ncbi:MAG: RNase J family beta-CASP ribonuclease [Clostridia bacterium]|nr:RNase J family beta-CASP ribonuclease [Clostridia bacterium]